MSMRAQAIDLPITFEHVGILAGGIAILDGISLTISHGSPTVLIGPNGAGKTTLLRVAMGLLNDTSGRINWNGQVDTPKRYAIVFQRPTMLRRGAAGNVRYALAAANVPRASRS